MIINWLWCINVSFESLYFWFGSCQLHVPLVFLILVIVFHEFFKIICVLVKPNFVKCLVNILYHYFLSFVFFWNIVCTINKGIIILWEFETNYLHWKNIKNKKTWYLLESMFWFFIKNHIWRIFFIWIFYKPQYNWHRHFEGFYMLFACLLH